MHTPGRLFKMQTLGLLAQRVIVLACGLLRLFRLLLLLRLSRWSLRRQPKGAQSLQMAGSSFVGLYSLHMGVLLNYPGRPPPPAPPAPGGWSDGGWSEAMSGQ